MLIFLSLWAFAEASFWFIPPDFLMIPLSIESKKKWLKISIITWL
ncbi:DedA family protein, partial [bacterium]|nr:DedA family protein [bacterium]